VLSFLPSVVALALMAFAGAMLVRSRPSPAGFVPQRLAASRALAAATAIQCAHFAEEWATDFHIRFPALFGLEPMPLWVFVVFNLAWIAIWVASIKTLRSAQKFAFFAAWFLAVAGMVNGVAHPLMALASGGYFPGLLSSPFIGLISLHLWRRLTSATSIENAQ